MILGVHPSVVVLAAMLGLVWSVEEPKSSVAPGLPESLEAVVARMARAEERLFPNDQIPWRGNEQGRLGWTEAYVLRAFVRAAVLTGDDRWVTKARRHVMQVLQRTDRLRGLRDYQGHARAGWSSIDRSAQGERIVWLVDTAHLGEAMLAVADLAAERDPQATAWAESVRASVETALKEFDEWWRPASDGTGVYVYGTDEPHRPGRGRLAAGDRGVALREVPLPWNQQMMAAKAMRRLGKTAPQWRERMRAIVRGWLRAVREHPDGGWTWTYWPEPMSTLMPQMEPVHYGGIALGLLGDLLDDGDVLVTPDMARAAVATANRIVTDRAMATDVGATRWVSIPLPATTSPGLTVQMAEWGRWYGGSCERWRAAMRTLWEAGDSPSSWLGWMELVSVGWCVTADAPPMASVDPFSAP
jgi:hypothetical protein